MFRSLLWGRLSVPNHSLLFGPSLLPPTLEEHWGSSLAPSLSHSLAPSLSHSVTSLSHLLGAAHLMRLMSGATL